VATADVVVANLPPQTLAAMRLDYESLKAVKPDIILTTVTAYGRGGPYSDRVGFDGVGQVMSGAVYMTGEEQQPYRAQFPPVDLFRTRDGWVLCQVIGKPLYRRWAELMGEPEWLTDPRFQDDISRGNHGAIISERMGRWCAERTSAEVLEILGKAKIPAGPVLKPQQALDDPQVNAMGFFQPTEFPGAPKPAPIAKVPVFLSQTPGS